MSTSKFHLSRFLLLTRQHFIHNAQLLLLSGGAYVGVIFIVLSIAQVGSDLQPHNVSIFQNLLAVFVPVFGILYVGHSFPAFRSKESTIHYLMLPASVLEKFVFEFVGRVGTVSLTLPVLYWITFHIQGYVFAIFTGRIFEPVGIQYLVKIDEMPADYAILIYALIIGAVLFALSLAFTGSGMFTKQPLVKTLFCLALIILFFVGYSYLIIEPLGLGTYHLPEKMWLFPLQEDAALTAVTVAFYVGTAVILLVAFRKLKEREV